MQRTWCFDGGKKHQLELSLLKKILGMYVKAHSYILEVIQMADFYIGI